MVNTASHIRATLPLPVIIDTDPGIDDAMALALAARSPELRLLAVTTVFGNTTREHAFRNAWYILRRFGAGHVPVFAGAAAPLMRPVVTAPETHGPTGFGHLQALEEKGAVAAAAEPPPDPLADLEAFAPVAMLRVLDRAAEPVTLIALGPLTNVALALNLGRDRMRAGLREIVLMGGSAAAPGNTTPVSEFNFWADPEAAQVVMQAGIPVRMVGLDVTRQILFHASVIDHMARSPSPDARFFAELMQFYVESHREHEHLNGCIMNDILAVALAIWPALGEALPMHVDVCTTNGATRGQSVCDRFGHFKQPPNAQVYVRCDATEVIDVTLRRVAGEGVASRELIARGLELGAAGRTGMTSPA